jgi:hypothetical protein
LNRREFGQAVHCDLAIFLSPHFFPILFFGQKAFYPIHDHRMVASLAAIATSVYAVHRLIVATCLACAYAIKRDSIAATGCRVHHLLFFFIQFKNLIAKLL